MAQKVTKLYSKKTPCVKQKSLLCFYPNVLEEPPPKVMCFNVLYNFVVLGKKKWRLLSFFIKLQKAKKCLYSKNSFVLR